MVRLVKGAYWDTEIKRAQVMGLDGFPVFTRKVSTDVSYIACARKAAGDDRSDLPAIRHPQCPHRGRGSAQLANLMNSGDKSAFEFQRLHGMGESLHAAVHAEEATRCRIYAPVGAHRDLLAYLVRRLLENGANSSFVNQIVDKAIPAEEIAGDPFDAVAKLGPAAANPGIPRPADLYGAGPDQCRGLGPDRSADRGGAGGGRARRSAAHRWQAGPMIAGPVAARRAARGAEPGPTRPRWSATLRKRRRRTWKPRWRPPRAGSPRGRRSRPRDRAGVLRRIADLYQDHAAEFFALAAREAGKTLLDGVGEVREAVDFLRFYAAEAERLEGEPAGRPMRPEAPLSCISPWNFPLAIFSGQIAAALAAGNAVVSKPAEQTPLIAARAVALMHEAGVPDGSNTAFAR